MYWLWGLTIQQIGGDALPYPGEAPCHATSPNGEHWVYIQPQHTGSATVQPYLRHVLGIKTCRHGHFMTPPSEVRNATFAFSFVANPFKRVVSYAAYLGVISGQRHQKTTHEQDVTLFRAWVKKVLDTKGRPRRHDGHASFYLFRQVDMFQQYPLRFVGCTSTLAADLQRVLKHLGYGNQTVIFDDSHCAASCGSHKNGTQFPGAVDWYDVDAEFRVRSWFESDFRNFGFSLQAEDMNDDSCSVRRSQGLRV